MVRRVSHSIGIHIGDMKLMVGGQNLPLSFGHAQGPKKVVQANVQQRTMFPSNAVKRITGAIDQQMSVFVICVMEWVLGVYFWYLGHW